MHKIRGTMKTILAFETSCDDTAVALVYDNGAIIAECTYSQTKEHAPYAGVVPEIGSRAHIEQILAVTKTVFFKAALSPTDVDYVAATFAPGLLGPLLVGAQFAKGFSVALGVPLVAVHHMEGHLFAGLSEKGFPSPPFLSLIVSGGHTALYHCQEDYRIELISQTLDDAAGEAFDKIGRVLGFGYPAGKIIDEYAASGDASRFTLPIALREPGNLNFSFSGLKTSALNIVRELGKPDTQTLQDFCASLCHAVAQALSLKALAACKAYGLSKIVVGGGVAANEVLRHMLRTMCFEQGVELFLPDKKHCTDNAVMIARAAIIKINQGKLSNLMTDVCANVPVSCIDELYK